LVQHFEILCIILEANENFDISTVEPA